MNHNSTHLYCPLSFPLPLISCKEREKKERAILFYTNGGRFNSSVTIHCVVKNEEKMLHILINYTFIRPL